MGLSIFIFIYGSFFEVSVSGKIFAFTVYSCGALISCSVFLFLVGEAKRGEAKRDRENRRDTETVRRICVYVSALVFDCVVLIDWR